MQGFKILTVVCALVSLVAAANGASDQCRGLEDGVFLPIAGQCSKYIICMQQTAIEMDCGAYHFNVKLSTCDHPSRAGCPGIAVDPVPTSDPRPTTPPCFAVANGISLPIPGQPRQYYYCMNNKAFVKDCGNLYFIAKHSACGVLSEDEPQVPISTARPVVPSIDHEDEVTACYGKPNGVNVPVAGSLRQYYYCMNNKAFLKDCGNLFFIAKYSACASISEPDQDHFVEELKMTDKYTEIARQVCRNKAFGQRVAYPGSCSWYFICTFNTGFLKSCSWREFNSNTAACDLPKNVGCQARRN